MSETYSDLSKQILESTPMAVLLWDSSGKILDWNFSFQSIFGYSKGSIENISQCSMQEDLEKEMSLLVFYRSRKHKTYTKKIIASDGTVIPCTVMTYPVEDCGLIVAYSSWIKKSSSEVRTLSNDFIRRQNQVLLHLTKSDKADSGDIEQALKETVKSASEALNCERSSVWVYNSDNTAIECLCLYRKKEDDYTKGVMLHSEDFPSYFRYLSEERFLAADDAMTDPNTAEFADVYLSPLNIKSMLDAPLRIGGKMVGVLCNEHVGNIRHWTMEEQNFAGSIADIISKSFESEKRKKAQDELKKINEELEAKVIERTRELQERMNEVVSLKNHQDGDYFLTSLVLNPLCANLNASEKIKTDFYIEQKKKFQFKKYSSEIGGDLCISGQLNFRNSGSHILTVNADAMGKSMQGAGGAIVLGAALNSILRTQEVIETDPLKWILNTVSELNSLFLAFNGSMLMSMFLGLISEETGRMLFVNAEHPHAVLLRDGLSSFISESSVMRKLGTMENPDIRVSQINLFRGDTVICGSDGKDDIEILKENGKKIMNEDENIFRYIAAESHGDLELIAEKLKKIGTLTDDLSLISISYL
ncbi:MAG TPA: SpoIIE family protein phosphatase [Leptospiraceae bacterium]|nr:SpoIIE family protein phosphatase [Leptospiraceae bacterium]